MPEVSRAGGGVEVVVGVAERVEVVVGVKAEEDLLGSPILDKKTNIIKFNINRIFTSESFDREKVLNKRGTNQDV